jgi:hypothetical protein
MNTSRRRSAKGKWQDAVFPVKWPKYAGERDTGSPKPPQLKREARGYPCR